MEIAILLPLKEKYTKVGSGAVSILVNSHLHQSKFKKTTSIYGSEIHNPLDKKKFIKLNSNKKFFSNMSYVNSFVKKIKKKTIIIELHNRPKYFLTLSKKLPSKKFILFFHNNPLDLMGSRSIKEREILYEKADILVFLSNWIKDKFFNGLKITNTEKIKVFYPGVKTIKKIPPKKNIILFVGKLNMAKGYDIFSKAMSKFIPKNKNWKAIAAGTEPRRDIGTSQYISELGEIDNDEVLKLIAKSRIAVACSNWEEPLGRLPIESASRACFPIVSNKGGLVETISESFSILKENSANNLFKKIQFLSKNSKKLTTLQKKVFKNFKHSLISTTKALDEIRNSIVKINISQKNNLKILHIASFNESANGNLFYSTANKLNYGFIKLGHFVQSIDDKNFLKKESLVNRHSLFNIKILNTVKNLKPDLILLGHTNKVSSITLKKIKILLPNIKISRWYIDSISPDFIKKNSNILFNNMEFMDNVFITSSPKNIQIKHKDKFHFIPNPVDSSIEVNQNFLHKDLPYDLFFALSHGQHRGVLKSGKVDERDKFINHLHDSLYNIKKFFISSSFNAPKWGYEYLYYLSKSRMGLNISRGTNQNLYSSDRIASLIGNGLLTFVDKKTNFQKLFTNRELVFFKNSKDLIKKINFFKNNKALARQYAKNAYIKAHKHFNSKEVCSYLLCKNDLIRNRKFYWSE